MAERGQLKAFLTQHLDPMALSPSAEAQRLMPLLKKARLHSTIGSVTQAVRLHLATRSIAERAGDNGHGPAISAPSVNGKAERRAELVRGADLLRDLAKAKETLATLVTQAQGCVDTLARIEADTVARRAHLERFAAEWL